MQTAAALFAASGYAATSTRQIAERVGLRQASLFHHFGHKDEILAELLDRTVRPALAFARWLGTQQVSPAAGLYALSWWDTHNLCANPDNLGALQLLPESRNPRFSPFWENRAGLRGRYAAFLARLIPSPAEAGAPAELLTDLVFGLVESVLTWFDRAAATTPEEVADAVASGCLGLAGLDHGAVVSAISDGVALVEAFASEEGPG